MFGLFKRKKSKKDDNSKGKKGLSKEDKQLNLEETLKKELEREEKREKKRREKGPNWASVFVLILTIGMGAVFWVYGRLTAGKPVIDMSQITLFDSKNSPDTQKQKDQPQTPRPINEKDGIIIFEKE